MSDVRKVRVRVVVIERPDGSLVSASGTEHESFLFNRRPEMDEWSSGRSVADEVIELTLRQPAP